MRKWSEKELEDYICENPQCLHDAMSEIFGGACDPIQIVGRQVPSAYGIMDLLVHVDGRLVIVELKATRAGDGAVGQLARYRENIINVCDKFSLMHADFQRYDPPFFPEISNCISYCLIAPAFDKNALRALGHWGRGLIVEKVNEHFVFSLDRRDLYGQVEFANSELMSLLEDYMQFAVDRERRIHTRRIISSAEDLSARMLAYTN